MDITGLLIAIDSVNQSSKMTTTQFFNEEGLILNLKRKQLS